MPANYDSWIAQVNEYVGEKIGVNIEMQVIDWGGWEPRRNVIINTNEPYDIIFGDSGTYNNDVQLGAYYEITDEDLATYAPGLLELIPADYWDAVRVNGKILRGALLQGQLHDQLLRVGTRTCSMPTALTPPRCTIWRPSKRRCTPSRIS